MKLGMDIGGSHVSMAVIDNNFKIKEYYTQTIHQNNIDKILKYFKNTIGKIVEKYEIKEINIAVPGIIKNNIIEKSVNLNMQNANIIELIEKILNKINKSKIKVKIKNDAQCAAIAEHKLGCLQGYANCVFLTLGTGIGSGIIIDNKLIENTEIGHTIIDPNGKVCNCGKKGCFEKYASMLSFKEECKKRLNLKESTKSCDIREYLENNINNKEVQEVINEYIKYLAIGISNIINTFEPEAIGIGGSFVYFEHLLLKKLVEYIKVNRLIFNEKYILNIQTAKYLNEAGNIGSCINDERVDV